MYRLKHNINSGLFEIHSPKTAYEGTIESIRKKSVEMGVQEAEFNYAVKKMVMNNHNIAEFGINGTFLFTKKKIL